MGQSVRVRIRKNMRRIKVSIQTMRLDHEAFMELSDDLKEMKDLKTLYLGLKAMGRFSRALRLLDAPNGYLRELERGPR